MLKILIVDDEPFIRQGLAVLIDWEAEGFFIAGEASNGEEALALIRKNEYDLIIADIRMPVMGGIELLKQTRENNLSKARFVILSGFFEFEYAKEAIRYSCTDYILKPIKQQELLTLLRNVSADCEKCREAEDQEILRDRAMLERHLTSVILGKYDAINLDYVRNHLELSDRIRYINIEIDMSDNRVRQADEQAKRAMQRRLCDHLRRELCKQNHHIIFDVNKYEDCYDVGFVYSAHLAEAQGLSESEYFEWISDKSSGVDFGITIQAGCEVSSLEKLSDSFRSATIAKLMHNFSDTSSSSFRSKTHPERVCEDISCIEQKRCMDDLVTSIERADKSTVEANVDKLYRMMSDANMDYKSIELNMKYVMFSLLHLAASRDPHINQDEVVNYIIENAFERGVSRGSQSHFLSFCLQYTDYLTQLNSPTSSHVISKIEQEVKDCYMQNISLKSLSEKYFINSAYLGQLFKKQFGSSFKDYLNSERINVAANLLLSTDKRVYEISEAVGYQSLDYFILKFVSAMGHTPTQYRKRFASRSAGSN